MTFRCEICDKYYSSSSSLNVHNRKYHMGNKVLKPVKKRGPKKQTNMCQYCNKYFSTVSNMNRHEKKCMGTENNKLEKLQKLYEKDQYKDILDKLLSEYNDIPNIITSGQSSAINNIGNHDVQNIQTQNNNIQNNNNSNNNSNNNNNNTQNINIQVVPLGQENLCDVLSSNEQLKVLKQKYESLEYLVKHIHFNQQYPQFQNIAISNLKDNVAYKYDDNAKDFIAVTKEELLNDLIENRMNDIHDFCNNNEISEKLTEKVEKLADNMENEDYLFDKKQQVKLIVYNGTSNKKRKLMLKSKN